MGEKLLVSGLIYGLSIEVVQELVCMDKGMAFTGIKIVSRGEEALTLKVNVRIHGCDLEHGNLCGTMEVINDSGTNLLPVMTTFWEGEIVDCKNYTFFTSKWGATLEDDWKFWNMFANVYHLRGLLTYEGGKHLNLRNYPSIYMRWKELDNMVDDDRCFYYVCVSREDGSISGVYYDPIPNCPFQELELNCTKNKHTGFSFSSYELQ